MKISVIIPTCNRPKLLKNCIDALLQQETEQSFEIIIVSDGPGPATKKLIEGYNNELFRYFELEVNQGPAAARNKGVGEAKGEILLFTDDDTIPDVKWIDAYAKMFQLIGKKSVAVTGKVQVPLSNHPTDYQKNISLLEKAEFITANCALTKIAFDVCGGFDEDFTMAWREDSDLHFKLIEKKIPVIYCPEAIVVHPVRKSPWYVSLLSEKKNIFNVLLFKKHPELYKSKVKNGPTWNYYIMVSLLLLSFAAVLLNNKKLFVPTMIIWLIMVAEFAFRRLKETSKRPAHILQMVITSAMIPVISIYWKVYGSLKYGKLLL